MELGVCVEQPWEIKYYTAMAQHSQIVSNIRCLYNKHYNMACNMYCKMLCMHYMYCNMYYNIHYNMACDMHYDMHSL